MCFCHSVSQILCRDDSFLDIVLVYYYFLFLFLVAIIRFEENSSMCNAEHKLRVCCLYMYVHLNVKYMCKILNSGTHMYLLLHELMPAL